ncbi:hypothetical protein F5Y18DRAFT_178640 [Xylariaceae sp. FL1019]|nr:hypothetical protein F5Y18DRAFT_178640 [Xylariaceae sp. FL1019]
MAELAAVGLASNILQFADIGYRLVAEAHELYKSTTGATALNFEVEKDTKELVSLLESIRSSHPTRQTAVPQTRAESQLQSLAEACNDISGQLLDTLANTKIDVANKNLFVVLKKTVASRSSRGKVDKQRLRLKDLREQSLFCMFVVNRAGQSDIQNSIEDLIDSNARLEANTAQTLDQIRDKIISADARLNALPVPRFNRADSHKALTPFRRDSLSRPPQAVKIMHSIVAEIKKSGLDTQIANLQLEVPKIEKQQRILETLRPSDIDTRHITIPAAHNSTFKWVFDHGRLNFADWLETGEGVYWINGKSGSGKSTLMRFVQQHPQTLAALEKWAGGRVVIIASYSWVPGRSLQRSQEGLLRTIASHICRQVPNLLETLFPVRWASANVDFEPWTVEELIQALGTLSLGPSSEFRFCFFIDDLDNYVPRLCIGESKIANLLLSLSSTSAIKICVASRPIVEMVHAFGSSPHMLRVQELTYNDIVAYASDQFEASASFRTLKATETERSMIVEDVAQGSQGVFLWAHLVVKSLLKTAACCNRFEDLLEELHTLPTTLEEYFKRMLSKLRQVEREQMVRMMQVTVSALEPLPLLAYHFLDQERDHPDVALEMPMSKIDIQKIEADMAARVEVQCEGLLVVDRIRGSRLPQMTQQVDVQHHAARNFFVRADFLGQWTE